MLQECYKSEWNNLTSKYGTTYPLKMHIIISHVMIMSNWLMWDPEKIKITRLLRLAINF